MEIIEFFGYTQPYIRPAPGQASFSLLQMIHENLLPDLCIAIYKAKKEKGVIKKTSPAAGESKWVDMEIVPVHAPASEEVYFLVLFKESGGNSRGRKRA